MWHRTQRKQRQAVREARIHIDVAMRAIATIAAAATCLIVLQGGQKIWHNFIFWYAVTLSNINRFSKLFHCRNQEKICWCWQSNNFANRLKLHKNVPNFVGQRVEKASVVCCRSDVLHYILPPTTVRRKWWPSCSEWAQTPRLQTWSVICRSSLESFTRCLTPA